MRTHSRLTTSNLLFLCLISTSTAVAATDPSCFGPSIKPDVSCPGELTDPAEAVSHPAVYAWRVFADINAPAFPGSREDTRRVWETWKSADDNTDRSDAIYLNDGSTPLAWQVTPRTAALVKHLVPIQQLELLEQETRKTAPLTPFFIPSNPLAEEVRTNRPAFDFILAHDLFNQQGQYEYASTHPGFDFPTAAKEVKAIWKELPTGARASDYYSVSSGGHTYVLVAMHVITKDVPFWFWSTFVHKDWDKDPVTGYQAPLDHDQPIPSSLLGSPFENYRLIEEQVQGQNGELLVDGNGAQLDWIDRTGEPTVLGNPNIETTLEQQSSCISCHAHASIGRASDGELLYNTFLFKVGPIPPSDMNTNGTVCYPLDFLWSLHNAHPKGN
jgi:hypothetical protein